MVRMEHHGEFSLFVEQCWKPKLEIDAGKGIGAILHPLRNTCKLIVDYLLVRLEKEQQKGIMEEAS